MQEQGVHQTSGSQNANLPAPHLDVRPCLLADDSLWCHTDAEVEIHQLSADCGLQRQSPMLMGGPGGVFPSWTS